MESSHRGGMSVLFSHLRAALLPAVAVCCAVAVAGCHRGPAMAQVKGKVLYKDGSVPRGGVCIVRFEPTKDSTAEVRKGASGAIGPDGSFEAWTRKQGDGVYLGDYAVTFAVLKGPMDPKPLILPKYMASAATPYKVTITEDVDDLKFEIEPLPGVTGGTASGSAAPATSPTPTSG